MREREEKNVRKRGREEESPSVCSIPFWQTCPLPLYVQTFTSYAHVAALANSTKIHPIFYFLPLHLAGHPLPS